jgi:allantoinase
VTPDGMGPAAVVLAGERIARVMDWDAAPDAQDLGDLVLMPGLVDTHVHVNEPGRTEWEGFASATRAAAAGGITTICDMPLNAIPATTTVGSLEVKRRAASRSAVVRVEYLGGLIPGNTGQLEGLARAGVRAFKCFLSPSGVPEFPSVGEAELREALPVLARLGLPLMVHAEDPALLRTGGPSARYADYLASRPAEAERSAIARLVRLIEWCPTPLHVVHLSSAESLQPIREARARGLPVTVETCPHYLSFAAEEIAEGRTEFKCAPPIRDAAERDRLWDALVAGDIDQIASDHSPCPPAWKATGGDFFAAWGGIASLELLLPAVWTGARARGLGPERLARWLSEAPARLVGLARCKGAISPGYDADLVAWDPDRRFVVDPARLRQRHPVTPYAGRELFGVVETTWVGGRIIPA